MQAVASVSQVFYEAERKSPVADEDMSLFLTIYRYPVPVQECKCCTEVELGTGKCLFGEHDRKRKVGIRYEIPAFHAPCRASASEGAEA